MAHRICPWWLGYVLASPVRKLMYNPAAITAPYVRPGMTVLEPGPGMGFFTLPLAQQVGPEGKVVAVDVELRMLQGLERRARKAGVDQRIESRVCGEHSMEVDDLAGQVGFVLAFAVVHEMPSAEDFFEQAAQALRPGGRLLLAEPAGHLRGEEFEAERRAAARAGLREVDRPAIRRSQAILLRKD